MLHKTISKLPKYKYKYLATVEERYDLIDRSYSHTPYDGDMFVYAPAGVKPGDTYTIEKVCKFDTSADALLWQLEEANLKKDEFSSDKKLSYTLILVKSLIEAIHYPWINRYFSNMRNPTIQAINNSSTDSVEFRIIIAQTISHLKQNKNMTCDEKYRSCARILYTIAKRIARDLVLTLTKSQPTTGTGIKELPPELQVIIFVSAVNTNLLSLQITNSNGVSENFVDLIKKYKDLIFENLKIAQTKKRKNQEETLSSKLKMNRANTLNMP